MYEDIKKIEENACKRTIEDLKSEIEDLEDTQLSIRLSIIETVIERVKREIDGLSYGMIKELFEYIIDDIKVEWIAKPIEDEQIINFNKNID